MKCYGDDDVENYDDEIQYANQHTDEDSTQHEAHTMMITTKDDEDGNWEEK